MNIVPVLPIPAVILGILLCFMGAISSASKREWGWLLVIVILSCFFIYQVYIHVGPYVVAHFM